MMKQLLLLLALVFTVSLSAQEQQTADVQPAPAGKFSTLMQKISVTATAGTGYYRNGLSDLRKLSLGELNIQYKASPLFSFGLGTIGTIQNDRSYFNSEGVLVPGSNDGEDGIENDEGDGPNDIDNIEEDNQNGDQNGLDNEGEFGFGDNLVGNFTFHFPGVPFFFQAATGYSFHSQDPAYSVMAGYNQKLFAGFGILAGIRYSDIISSKNYVSKSGGIKAEMGLSWNF